MQKLAVFILAITLLLTGCFDSSDNNESINEAITEEKTSDELLTAMVIKYYYNWIYFRPYDATKQENDGEDVSNSHEYMLDTVITYYNALASNARHSDSKAQELSSQLAAQAYGNEYNKLSKSSSDLDAYKLEMMELQAYITNAIKGTKELASRPSIEDYKKAIKSFSVKSVTPYNKKIVVYLNGKTLKKSEDRKLIIISNVLYNGKKWQINAEKFHRQNTNDVFDTLDINYKTEMDNLPKDISGNSISTIRDLL